MEELIQKFIAVDENGTPHDLQVYQSEISVATRAHPSAVQPGLKSIVTVDGQSVHRLSKGQYEIVGTGVNLSSSDPDAP